jgi:hypothetical protein
VPEIHPRKIRVRAKNWTIATVPLKGFYGYCDHPSMPAKQITIDPNQVGIEMLDTIIHEYLHAALPDLSEDVVVEVATDLAKVLWDLDYRGEWDE